MKEDNFETRKKFNERNTITPYSVKNEETCNTCGEKFIVYQVKKELRTIHPCSIIGVRSFHNSTKNN